MGWRLGVVFLLLSFAAANASNECTRYWRRVDWEIVPFIDLNAQYLSYQFKIPRGQKLKLQFTGDFPLARYMSYHVYDQATENPTSWISDSEISPDAGSVNPYQQGVDRYSPNRRYTLKTELGNSINEKGLELPYDEKHDRYVDIWYRIYLNEEKAIKAPQIFAFDQNDKPVSCPPLALKQWSIATEDGPQGIRIPTELVQNKVPLPMLNGELHFFRPSTSALGANAHNAYFSTRLDGKALFPANTIKGRVERRQLRKEKAIQDIGNVAVFYFRVPGFPNTKKKLQYFSGEEDVRYWSVCLSGADTSTSHCVNDDNAKLVKGKDGQDYVVFIIGPELAWLEKAVASAGFNFMSHASHRIPILFYRQMLPQNNFSGNAKHVLALPPEKVTAGGPFEKYYSEASIGEFAPVGRECWLSNSFMASLCGVALP